MGFISDIKNRVSSAVSSATKAVTDTVHDAEKKVEDTAASALHKADEYAGVIKDKAADLVKPAVVPQNWAAGFTDAFKHTTADVRSVVSGTVKAVERSIDTAGHAVSDAGQAVQRAGQQVLDSGRRVVNAGEKAVGDVASLARDAGRVLGDTGQVVADAGRAAWHAGEAVVTGDPRELDAAKNAVADARLRVADAHAAIDDAHRQVSDLGAQGSAVSSAIGDAKSVILAARDALGTAEQRIGDAVNTVVGAPRQLMTGVEQALEKGGAEAYRAVEAMPGGKDMLGGLARYSEGAQKMMHGIGSNNVFEVIGGVREQAGGLVQFGKGAYDSPAGQFAKQKVLDYANGFNVDKQIADLKPGETYTLKAGADVHVEFGGEAKGTMSIARQADGSYKLNANGVAGLNANFTPEQLGKEGLSASAHVLLGGAGEFKFDNAADAERASHIFEKAAAGVAVQSTAVGPLGIGGQVVARQLMPSNDDIAFLKSHCRSLELGVSGSVDASLGAALPGFEKKLGATVSGGLSSGRTVRIDMNNGEPTGITVKHDYAGSLSGGVGLQVPGKVDEKTGKPGTGSQRLALQGSVQVQATVEEHYDLPKGFSLDQALQHPGETLDQVAKAQQDHTTKVTVKVDGEVDGGLPVPLLSKLKKGFASGTVTFEGKPSEVLNAEVIGKALNGDLEGAAKDASQHVKVTGNVHAVEKKQWGVDGLGLTIAGVGGKLTAYAERTKDEPNAVEFTYANGQGAVKLSPGAQALADEARKLATRPRVLRG